ncbi:MAG TPA: cytochrome c, partial [Xanthobacteraceae bacterium]|nr:cytochrome c [Xanthobacteraceae bacterium]
MSMHDRWLLAAALLGLGCGVVGAQSPDLGRAATPEEIAAWDISIDPGGADLPPGGGTARQGEAIFAAKCAACHGEKGAGKPNDQLVGGGGTLTGDKPPVKTVGSYWPYATTLFDYIRRAMPFKQPGTLTANQVYALSAFILNLNAIVPENAVMDAKSLPQVKMPNRNGFVSDPRPDVGAKTSKG